MKTFNPIEHDVDLKETYDVPFLHHFVIPNRTWGFFPKDDIIHRLGRMVSVSRYDRFDFLNKYSKYNFKKYNTPLPQEDTSLIYEVLCFERAIELTKKYEKIAVLWSGGVDSTTIICSLLMVGHNPKDLIVVCSENSKEEYPEFFYNLPKYGVTVSMYSKYENINEYITTIDCDVILSGFVNDQLYHQTMVHKYPEIAFEGWCDGLEKIYNIEEMSSYLEGDLTLFYQYSLHLGWELENFFDWCVLFNFGTQYESVKNLIQLKCTDEATRNKIDCFYDTQKFQNWAFTNRQLVKEHWVKSELEGNQHYKPECKNIILEFTGDKDYYMNKGKKGSYPIPNENHNPIYSQPVYCCAFDSFGVNQNLISTHYSDNLYLQYKFAKVFMDTYRKDEPLVPNLKLGIYYGYEN